MTAVSVAASEAPPACREVLTPRRNGAALRPTGQGVWELRDRRAESQAEGVGSSKEGEMTLKWKRKAKYGKN